MILDFGFRHRGSSIWILDYGLRLSRARAKRRPGFVHPKSRSKARRGGIQRPQVVALCAAALTASSSAAAQTGDKDQYHLFNPTPAELLREMSTDRPDTTETPTTVDAGHLQVEFSLIDYVRDGELESLAVMPTNFRIGVLNDVEFAIVVTPYQHSEFEKTPGVITSDSGFGDIDLRLKVNLWGNDNGRTAFAVMPFITLPTASDMLGHGHVEGGIVFPFAMELDEQSSLGLMAEFDAVYDPSRAEYDLEFVHTAALGRSIIGDLGGYIEYIGIASSAPGSEYQILLGTGLTYALNSHWQLDAGVNIGLAGGAPDLNPFVGMSIRF